jgi:hypothetical protein
VTDLLSVLDKAVKLQSESRRLETGAEGQDQANRVARRVAEIEAALTRLSSQARAARALRQHTTADVSLAGLDAGRRDLARRAAGSIPSDSAFVAARRKVDSTANALATAVQQAWKEWADGRMTALPDDRIAMLEIARQAPARATLKTLRGLAGEAGTTADGIAQFAAAYAGLREELDEAKDVPEEILGLLDSMQRRPVTLRDVTDDQIALLRAVGLDSEIQLRRIGG